MNEPGDSTPAPPPIPASAAAEGNPWEQRDRLGFGGGLVDAIKLFTLDPAGAFAATRRQGDFVSPLLFAVIIGWLGALVGQIWQFVFQESMLSYLPPEIRNQIAFFGTGSAIGLIVSMIVWPVLIVVGLFIWAGIFHVCLLMVGGLNQSKSGFEGTFRACGYAHVAQLAQVVPFLGGLITLVWSIFLITIGAATLHDTSRGKALAAALIPLFICCACVVMGAMMLFGAIAGFDQ